MKIVHVINEMKEEVIREYFVDEEGNEVVDYTVEEFIKSIKQSSWN